MDVLAARSHNEAVVYVLMRECRACGAGNRDVTDEFGTGDGATVTEYTSFCRDCTNIDTYTFRLPESDPQNAVAEVAFGGDEPSSIIDAGEWLVFADRTANGGPVEPTGLTPQQRADAALALHAAAAAVREVVKFIRPGEERVSVSALWTERGRAEFERDPWRMSRGRMEAVETAYREAAERLAGGGPIWSR
jgi:hypothetical protein